MIPYRLPQGFEEGSQSKCVLFAVYHQNTVLEPAEGVKQAVMQHKLQFVHCAIATVKEKKLGLAMLSVFRNRNDKKRCGTARSYWFIYMFASPN